MRGQEAVTNVGSTAITATTAQFELRGGTYVFMFVASNFNSGNAQLQVLGPDGTTFIGVHTALTANGATAALALPPGQYKIALSATMVGGFYAVDRVPSE